MEIETTANNPVASESAISQEPQGSLTDTDVTAIEGTGTEAVQSETNTVTDKGQEKGANLFKGIEKLSPAEQKEFKKWQTEYTTKLQSLSEFEKRNAEVEGYLNNLVDDPEISAILKARQTKAEKEPDFSKMSDQEIFDYSVDKRVKSQVAELEAKMESKYGNFIQNKLVSEGNKIMEDFAESKKLPVDDVKELAKYAINHRVTLEEAYKVAYFDKIPVQAKQEALEDLELKKNANLELGNIPSGLTPVMPTKPTFAEAAKAAEKQTGISWAKVKTE